MFNMRENYKIVLLMMKKLVKLIKEKLQFSKLKWKNDSNIENGKKIALESYFSNVKLLKITGIRFEKVIEFGESKKITI